MPDITKLSSLVSGIQRQVDLTANAVNVGSLKVGAVTPTELTKAILDNLVNLQNGSQVTFVASTSGHAHDGRYYTETELGSSAASSGSDLIGDDGTYSNFTPAAATVKGALSGIDTALGSIVSDTKNVKVSADDTTPGFLEDKIVVAVGTNTSAILETSVLNDGANEDLQIQLDQSKIDHGSIAGLGDDDHTIYTKADGTRAFTGNQAMGGYKLTGLAAGTSNGDSVRYEQLVALESLIQNFEFQESVIDYITNNTLAPPTEVSGDRYLLSHDGGTPHADWDGAEAGDIVEFNGSLWVETDPSVGMMISVDDENSSLRQWSGSAWVQKYFESTTASTGLTKVGFDVQLDSSAAGPGLGFSAGSLYVDAGNGLEVNGDQVRIAAAAAGDGLAGGGDYALSVAYAPSVQAKLETAGESFSATTLYAVRYGQNAETAGRVYKADNDASSTDNFHVIGLVLTTGSPVTAGNTVPNIFKMGLMTVTSHGFTVGKPLWLGASGALTSTAPSAANSAVVKVGVVKDANTIDVQIQIMGIN